jgi:hypothetical protein
LPTSLLRLKSEIKHVHLWYEKKHGIPCRPYTSVEAGIETWISTSAMLGVRLDGMGEWIVYAPRGLFDVFNMVLRPNPVMGIREVYDKKLERWRAIWPTIIAEPRPAEGTLTLDTDIRHWKAPLGIRLGNK